MLQICIRIFGSLFIFGSAWSSREDFHVELFHCCVNICFRVVVASFFLEIGKKVFSFHPSRILRLMEALPAEISRSL